MNATDSECLLKRIQRCIAQRCTGTQSFPPPLPTQYPRGLDESPNLTLLLCPPGHSYQLWSDQFFWFPPSPPLLAFTRSIWSEIARSRSSGTMSAILQDVRDTPRPARALKSKTGRKPARGCGSEDEELDGMGCFPGARAVAPGTVAAAALEDRVERQATKEWPHDARNCIRHRRYCGKERR